MACKRLITLSKVLLLSLLLGIISCEKFEELETPTEGVDVILNYDIFDTFITLRMIDAPTGELVGAADDEKVTVNITGAASDAIVDQLGNHSTVFQSVYGIINLALNPKDPWVPSEDNILELNFNADNNSYKASDLSLELDSVGNYICDIYMEKNNVESLGVKEYTLILPLDETNSLKDEFSFMSTGDEVSLDISAGTKFLDQEGAVVTGDFVKMNIKLYLDKNKAAVPHSLISNLKTLDGSVSEYAIDYYNIFELSFYDECNEAIQGTSTPFPATFQIDEDNYNPNEKRAVKADDFSYLYCYNEEDGQWEEQDKFELSQSGSGYKVETLLSTSSFKSLGNSASTCTLSGQIKFQMMNTFEQLPVGANLLLYREFDNKLIGSKSLSIEGNGQQFDFNYTSIEGEAIRFQVKYQSVNNPFNVNSSDFYFDEGCGILEDMLVSNITSTRVQIDGQLRVNCSGFIPTEGLDAYVDIYQTSDNTRLYRKRVTLTSSENLIDISTGTLADNDVYVKLTPITSIYTVDVSSQNNYFNTSLGSFNWVSNVSIQDNSNEFNFIFDIDDSFGNQEIKVKADFYNKKTKRIDRSVTFLVSNETSVFHQKLLLSGDTNYTIKIKRFADARQFMAFPYEKEFNSSNKDVINFNIELLPVTKEYVNAEVEILCGESIIYPSINGMYRTVWDDTWTNVEIEDGFFIDYLEIGATYQIGTVYENKLESIFYDVEETDIDVQMEIDGDFCEDIGW